MSFGLPKAEHYLCFNKVLICTTSYLSINLGFYKLFSHCIWGLVERHLLNSKDEAETADRKGARMVVADFSAWKSEEDRRGGCLFANNGNAETACAARRRGRKRRRVAPEVRTEQIAK